MIISSSLICHFLRVRDIIFFWIWSYSKKDWSDQVILLRSEKTQENESKFDWLVSVILRNPWIL